MCCFLCFLLFFVPGNSSWLSLLLRPHLHASWTSLNMPGDPLAIRSLFFGINPPLPDLKGRILGNNKKSFHARTLDTSDLV